MATPLPAEPSAPEEPTDRDKFLMRRVAEGDREAFAEIFLRVAPSALGILIRLLRQRSLAEEALQETFLQAWLQADSYRPEQGSPRQWLLMIARSRGLDQLRRDSSRKRREELFTQEDPEALDPVGTARLESLERRDTLRAGLGRLSTAQRACLKLAFGEDLSQSEIAERLAMPLGSVKSRVRLGMRKLGGMLTAEA